VLPAHAQAEVEGAGVADRDRAAEVDAEGRAQRIGGLLASQLMWCRAAAGRERQRAWPRLAVCVASSLPREAGSGELSPVLEVDQRAELDGRDVALVYAAPTRPLASQA